MKTYLKYFLLILLILILMGCNSQNGNNLPVATNTEMPPAVTSAPPIDTPPAVTEIVSPQIKATFILMRADSFMANDAKDYIIDWQIMIQQAFNIRIVVFDTVAYGKDWSDTNGEINLLAESGENIFAEIMEYKESSAIVALNDYLKKSATWKELPESFRNTYKDTEGNIWALPKSDSISVMARAYNRKWLKTMDMGIPGNVNELYEILHAFTYKDPDGNGIMDSYGTAITRRTTSLITFKDIFEAFGCRMSYSYSPQFRNNMYTIGYKSVPVGYNPDSGMIEDYSNSEEMKDSLEFIKALIDSGIARLDSNTFAGGYFESGEYGSQMGLLEDNLINSGLYEYTYSLNSNNEKAVTSIPMADNEAYFLFSKTIDKDVIIPLFVDTFYGTREGYLTAFAGLTGPQFKYEVETDGLVVNEKYNKGVTHIDLLGELSWFDLNIKRPDLDKNLKQINVYDLLDDPRMYVLQPKHMSFLENLNVRPVNATGTERYEKDLIKIFGDFYEGNLSPDDVMSQLEFINNVYNIDSLIEQTNERWLIGN